EQAYSGHAGRCGMSAETAATKDHDLAHRFLDFSINLKRLFRSVLVQSDRNLSEERYRSLLCLIKMEEAGLSELSERLSISASSLCIMLGKLEEEGLVERHRRSEDRRQVQYSCTAKGRERVIAAQEELLERLASQFQNLSADKRDRLLKALNEMDAVLACLNNPSFKE
ncbi:MAG TPA: MarR family transcriptional regulator, partial [Treponema sp.]|nr:MarR family transcriptional regulator [Treponema sp.]